MRRVIVGFTIVITTFFVSGCQQPTAASSSTSVDDFVDATVPASVTADSSTDGRTYRVARSNEADLVVPYQYKTSFSATVTMNSNSSQDKYDIEFPVTLAQASVKVNQASGGIVTPPSGSDTEHSEYVITEASGNKFGGANTSQSMHFDVWYTMPSQQKEALISLSFSMYDNDGRSFTKTATINITP